jgi:hypothetical protein
MVTALRSSLVLAKQSAHCLAQTTFVAAGELTHQVADIGFILYSGL